MEYTKVPTEWDEWMEGDEGPTEWHIINFSDCSHLVGKLKTLIDAALPDGRQAKATKDLAQQAVFDWLGERSLLIRNKEAEALNLGTLRTDKRKN